MNKSVLFLSTLIIIAFCSSSRVISYDSVINKLVELNQVAGRDNSDIGLLVSQVSSSLKEMSDKFDEFMSGLNQGCDGGNSLLSSFLKKLEADKVQAQSAADKANEDNLRILGERDAYTETLKNAQGELEDLKAKIAKEVEDFKTFGGEAEQKLVIIKTLKDIITDELLAPQKGQTSFVQIKTFNDKLRQLKSLLEKSKDTTYSPLVSTLLSLAQGNGWSDQKILSQIMEVLSKLEKNLGEFRKKQNDEGKKNIETLKSRADEKVKQIRSIALLIADANSNYQDNEAVVKTSGRDIEAIQKETERKQSELDYWNKICGFQKEVESNQHNTRDAVSDSLKKISTNLLG